MLSGFDSASKQQSAKPGFGQAGAAKVKFFSGMTAVLALGVHSGALQAGQEFLIPSNLCGSAVTFLPTRHPVS